MPKKKHRRASPRQTARNVPSPGEASRRRERDLQALLAQFSLWRRDSVPQQQADGEASHVEPLLRLKADQLDSPDPTLWTEELIEVLLTQVAPRKIIQPREQAMEQAPALSQFFAFLVSRGRWHRRSLELEEARRLLEELELDVLEAADDPTARSFSGNILTYAATLGIGLDRPEHLDAFLQWYNTALTDAERHEVSDTGRLANPITPFDPADWSGAGTGMNRLGEAVPAPSGASVLFAEPGSRSEPLPPEDAPPWPWFLPEASAVATALEPLPEDGEDLASMSAACAEVPLVQRAERLLEFIGDGRPVTATGAMKLADVRRLIDEWGIDPGPGKVTTMWQIDAIVGPWTALIAGGWIELTSTRVLPSADPIVPYAARSADAAMFAQFAHTLMLVLLISSVRDDPQQGGLRGGEDTAAALLFAGGPTGLTLPDPFGHLLGDGGSPYGSSVPSTLEDARQLLRVESDLHRLSRYGLLRYEERADGGSHVHGSSVTLAAIVSMIDILRDSPS